MLISGRGSNMQAIVDACLGEELKDIANIQAVISNNPDAKGLEWAQSKNIPTQAIDHKQFNTRLEFDDALGNLIHKYSPDYILLAGFMRILTPNFINRFKDKIINIHPSLLPSFTGLNTHESALETGVQCHGCTVHFVTPELDNGPIIAQGVVPVNYDDNADTLANRVLEVEHKAYTNVVKWLANDLINLENNKVKVKNINNRLFI